MLNPTVVVQCFNKPDTLQAVCRSLLCCKSSRYFNLIIWSDSPIGSHNEDRYAPAYQQVLALIDSLRLDFERAFASVEILGNTVNLGPYRTCKLALDHAFRNSDFTIFAEDDAIFETDALEWFLACAQTEEFRSGRVWAIAGESIFFDARGKTVDTAFRAAATEFAIDEQLIDKFTENSFIPSTCFATSAHHWAEIGVTRGETNGDVTLCKRCENEGKTCIQPIIARVRDVGMLHDLGYSVSIHTKAGIQEIKNTYLASNDFPDETQAITRYMAIDAHRRGEIYRRTTLLEGFGMALASVSSEATSPTPAQVDPVHHLDAANAAPRRAPMLQRTLAMIERIPPGTYVPQEQKCFDDDELGELGVVLNRLVYAPSQIRKKLESYGASIVPANFYSEVPTQLELEASFAKDNPPRYDAIFADDPSLVNYLIGLTVHSAEFAPPRHATPGKFHWDNGSFSYSDAMSYYAMLRKVQPETVVEIGCGWSTLVAQAALARNGKGRIVGIEPYPPEFLPELTLVKERVQNVPLEFFNTILSSGDVLFIDSTHAVKHGSDCLYLYLHILPQLQSNLFVHVHDVFLPNTFSQETLRDKQIYWTEQYLLYAYLLGNPRVTTLYGSAYHNETHPDLLKTFMHGRYGAGGGSFWFEARHSILDRTPV